MKETLEKGNHVLMDFEKASDIHYLRWLIIDDKNSPFTKEEDKGRSPKLVYSSNFDGSVEKHLDDLSSDGLKPIQDPNHPHAIDPNENLMDQIYGCCTDYPEPGNRTPDTRKKFFKANIVKVAAFYRGSPRRSVKQILQENDLRIHLKQLLEDRPWNGATALEMHRTLQKEILEDPKFSWAKEKFKMPRINYFKLGLLGLVILILLPVVLIWVIIVQLGYEKKDKYYENYRSDLNAEKVEILEEYEDLTAGENTDESDPHVKNMVINYQNQFSQLVDLKPGKVRRITFKAMMLFARVLIPIQFVDGRLMNIPTIHFARWVLFDDEKRVLFFSNFDGSWQQYLGDFIDQSGWGLTAIFSNTTVFPKTNWLGLTGILSMRNIMPTSKNFFPGGAYNEEHFLAWSRDTELPTDIWYSAYPELSIKNVNNNSWIRVLLQKNLNKKKAKKFFELI